MTVEVRTIEDDELEAWSACMGTAFLKNQGPEWGEFRRKVGFDLSRTFSALDDGLLCGTARSFATDLRLPGGGSVTAAAITQVTVRPTHRRRGHLTRMMHAQLADVIERGEPMAILVAAEWPIYGRFGYGPAIYGANLTVDSPMAALVDGDHAGTTELVALDELRRIAPAIFERHQQQTAGAISRDETWWDVTCGVLPHPEWKDKPNRYRAFHRGGDGEADGFVTWEAKERWSGMRAESELSVGELIATTPEASRDLWRFLVEIDLTVRIEASNRSIDDPLPLLLRDGRAVRTKSRDDFIWVRVLDVAAALGARTYSAPGRVVLEVVDGALGRGGRFALDGGPEGATCAPTDESADLTVPVQALSAISLGGTSLHGLAAAGLLDEHRAGAVATAARMFHATRAPWCTTSF